MLPAADGIQVRDPVGLGRHAVGFHELCEPVGAAFPHRGQEVQVRSHLPRHVTALGVAHVLVEVGRNAQECDLDPSEATTQVAKPCPCGRSEEHTSELQSLMRISYAVFCLKKKKTHNKVILNTECKTRSHKINIIV